jgi:hypothetical protein
METESKLEHSVHCRRTEKTITKETCQRCNLYLGEKDPHDLFSRCAIVREKTLALLPLYRKKGWLS